MTDLQEFWPEGDAWFGVRGGRLSCRIGSAFVEAPPGALCPMFAPRSAGGPVLWLDPTGTLTSPAGPTPLAGLAAAAGDPGLTAAVTGDGTLLLATETECTSVSLPALPTSLVALGPSPGHGALALLVQPHGVHAVHWQGERVDVRPLCGDAAADAVLLEGNPPAAVLRVGGGPARRLLAFLLRSVPWPAWTPLPPLLLPPDADLRLRQTESGLGVRIAEGLWLVHRGGAWHPTPLRDTHGCSTFIHGRYAALDHMAWPEKEHLPRREKLAVGRCRQRIQAPICQENSSQSLADFVHSPRGG